jgi:hypothetical protein
MDRRGELGPRAGALFQRGETGQREGIHLAVATAGLSLPLARDHSVALERVQSRVERPFLAPKRVAAAPLDRPRDPVAVQRPVAKDGHDESRRIPF